MAEGQALLVCQSHTELQPELQKLFGRGLGWEYHAFARIGVECSIRLVGVDSTLVRGYRGL